MARVNAIDLYRAAQWLRAYEGTENHAMNDVADWLDREADRRIDAAEARHAAKRHNVSLNLAKRAVAIAKKATPTWES